MGETPALDVMVIGSLNHDIIAGVDAGPGPGETVLARTLTRTNGGKGGNQVVAAARAGASARMVSAVGADAEGDMQVDDLTAHGVDVSGISREKDLRTSLALIWVTPDGENSIIVTPGAKDRVTPDLVRAQAPTTRPAASGTGGTGDGGERRPPVVGPPVRVVLAQSEVGAAVSDAAAELATTMGSRYVLSCGPVVLPSASTLRQCDPIIVNASEARDLLNQMGADASVPEGSLAEALLAATDARSVIATLGSRGSLLAQRTPEGTLAVAIPPVPARHVVDTTGAGDTYCGVVAARLALGDTLQEACTKAAAVAAESVGWHGARPMLGSTSVLKQPLRAPEPRPSVVSVQTG